MAASPRETIQLKSEASGYFYTTFRNKRNQSEKLRLKKYDPHVRKHVWFVETKI